MRYFSCIFLLIITPLLYSCSGKTYQIKINQPVNSTNRVILLLHGLSSTPNIWTSNIQQLLTKEFNASIVTFAYPTDLFDNKNVERDVEIADKLNSFLQEHKLKEKELIIISHSNGAIVALQYISRYPETHGVEKLVLLGPPLFGSTAADWFNNLPATTVGAQVKDLLTYSPALLDLNAQIHKVQKYFPETLVLLGTEDTLAPLETGAIPYSFAINIKMPLHHAELRKIDTQPVLFSSIRDFLEGKPVSSNMTIQDAPNHLIFRITGLASLFTYQDDFTWEYPPTELLENAGLRPFVPPSTASFTNKKSGLTFADVIPFIRDSAFPIFEQYKSNKPNRKYDRFSAVKKRFDETLWVEDIRKANFSAAKGRGIYMPWGKEFDFMSWEEVQQELRGDGIFSILQTGPGRRKNLLQPALLLQKMYKFNKTEEDEKTFSIFEVFPRVEYIGEDTFVVRNLPGKHYKINLSQTLKNWIETTTYKSTNFDIWLGFPFKEVKFEIFIHGPGIHVRYFDPTECQITPNACTDSVMKRPPFLPEDLMDAINIQDWADAKRLILAGIGINHYGHSGSTVRWSQESGSSIETPIFTTPLLAAIDAKQEDLAILLLEYGADPNKMDSKGNTVFSQSVYNKLFLLTKKLLVTGETSLAEWDKRMTLPILMALRGNAELMQMVCPREMHWDTVDAVGRSLLNYAADNPDPGPLTFLLAKNPPLPKNDKRDMFFSSLLRQNTPEALDFLLDKYPLNPNDIKSSTGVSVLHDAACHENPEWLIVLKKHGAFVNRNNQEQSSILASAVHCNRRENVEWLIKNGAQAHAENIIVEK